ncbi:hypothetical protein BOG92_000285 [Streptomyces sp. WAC00263]|nr:hypothetical protein BOG92_000285 [Streptomyces sp. WAC00263]
MVTVIIPEYVLGHWWEQILHNQRARRKVPPQVFRRPPPRRPPRPARGGPCGPAGRDPRPAARTVGPCPPATYPGRLSSVPPIPGGGIPAPGDGAGGGGPP